MDRYFHPEEGFLINGLHATVPDGSVPISLETHLELLTAQDWGKCIQLDSVGRPVALAPELALDKAIADKAREIRAGYDTALAGVLAGAEATATGVAVGSALMAASDPEGLEYLVARLTARRVELEQALLAAQADAAPVPAVLAIMVSYPT
ncbi:hypothetical protein DA2_0204 [Desulfovibrio sp. A2]|nr:hypothetical protein DA2_0204 [Desulfovibrio sp. A2]